MIVATLVGAVLFFATPCPDDPAGSRGCTYFPEASPPVVYVDPHQPREWRRFVWWHELGHVWQHQTTGSAGTEKIADRFANCHIPYYRRTVKRGVCRGEP